MKKIFTLLFVSLLFGNCSHKPEVVYSSEEENTAHQITHLPFKFKQSERWGLIGVDGKILFQNRFKDEPSYVVNGIFYVRNANELYEYYSAKEKPARINNKAYRSNYYSGSIFYEDIIPVKDNQHFVFIRKDGSQAFVFDSYDGKKINWISNFNDGMAQFCTESNKYGYINTKGEVVLPPKYSRASDFSEGLAVVMENYNPCEEKRNKKSVAYIIDKSGKKQSDLEIEQHEENKVIWFEKFVNGLAPCKSGICETDAIGTIYYVNRKGEKVIYAYHNKEKHKSGVNMPPQNTYIISKFNKKGYALCVKQVKEERKEYIGIISAEGKMIVDMKYEYYIPEDEFQDAGYYIDEDFACISDRKKFGLIDFNGNVICPFRFDRIYPFYDGEHAFARMGKTCFLINKKGERMDNNEYEMIGTEEMNKAIY
ncbi:MAG: WG repeat-containing protein [Prevotellaceae bacterium]|jgi:hypothetical protein|nr:WG repeat-containing protein [Prevotellaceae bacterium]